MTNGERLYKCLLQVKPTQFREDDGTPSLDSVEPRTPWKELTDASQWTQADWERIAEEVPWSQMPSDALYHTVLRVCPYQRRRSGYLVMRHKDERHAARFREVAALYLAGGPS